MDPVVAGFLGGLIPGALSVGSAAALARLSRKHSLSTLYSALITGAERMRNLTDEHRDIGIAFDTVMEAIDPETDNGTQATISTTQIEHMAADRSRALTELRSVEHQFRLAVYEIRLRGSIAMNDEMDLVCEKMRDLNEASAIEGDSAFDEAVSSFDEQVNRFVARGQQERRLWRRG